MIKIVSQHREDRVLIQDLLKHQFDFTSLVKLFKALRKKLRSLLSVNFFWDALVYARHGELYEN